MDAATLRELQAPLKKLSRDDPLSSRTPLEAEAAFEADGITATVQSWADPIRAGLHPATGGDGADVCSGDMLLQALLACAGVTLRSVATAMGIDIVDAELHATGMFDARGTLGISRDVPIGVQDIKYRLWPSCRPMPMMRPWPSWASLRSATALWVRAWRKLPRLPSVNVRRERFHRMRTGQD